MEERQSKHQMTIDVHEAYDIIEKSNLIIFKWTLSEDIPTDFVSENISIFGYTPEDFYTGRFKDYWDFVFSEDRERVKRQLQKARNDKSKDYKNQYRVVDALNRIRWVEEWVVHDYDTQGNLTYEKGILRDITDSYLVAEKLKESELRYKSLFEHAPAFIFTFSEEGILTNYNQIFKEAVLGHALKAVYQLSDFLGSDYAGKGSALQFFNYCEAFINERIELDIMKHNGTKITIEMRNTLFVTNEKTREIQVVANDITAKNLAQNRIKYLTEHDPLTGLFNRSYFDMSMSKCNIPNVSIIIGDVNGLKMVNDAFGHKYGDLLLKAIAAILKDVFDDPTDIIARLSGDEFAILTFRRNIEVMLDKVHAKCKLQRDYPFQLDIALGYSTRKNRKVSLESVFREADHAMYKIKLRSSKYIKSRLIQSLQDQLSKNTVETTQHCNRMKQLATGIGKNLHLGDAMMEELELSIMMHDIGLVSVAESILNKPGKLTEDEMKEVMKHSEIGYHLLVATPNLAGVGEYVLAHHEHYDGGGYPQGLKGMEIPLISRILSVVDAYDAMTSDRPYRKALTKDQALAEMHACSGSQFDPGVVFAFAKWLNDHIEG